MRHLALLLALIAGTARAELQPDEDAMQDPDLQRLPDITVTAPHDPLLDADRHMQSLKSRLPGSDAGPSMWLGKVYQAPNPKDSVWARPEDEAAGLVWDVRQENNRRAQLP